MFHSGILSKNHSRLGRFRQKDIMSRMADFYFVEFHCVSLMFLSCIKIKTEVHKYRFSFCRYTHLASAFCSSVLVSLFLTKAHIFLFCLFFNALTLCFSGILSKNHSRLERFRQKDIMSRR